MKFIILLFLLLNTFLFAEKIGNITNIVGVRNNQLIGYSLVVGLKKTGDGTTSKFTLQSVSNMLKAMNIDMNPNDIKSKNVAAVVVTTSFSAFSKQGDNLDVTVSSIGDAKSLEGGTLLMTPLKGVDGKIYALAQGQVSIGGKNDKGEKESHPTSGIVYKGGIVEREIENHPNNEKIILSLKQANFENANNIQKIINKILKGNFANAIDSKTIELKKPDNKDYVEFLAFIENLNIDYKQEQKIIINEKTGTIISGTEIEVKPIVITQGNLTIKIVSENKIEKLSGSILIDKDLNIGINENEIYTKKGTTTIANIVRALQKLGSSPKEIISIIENIKSSGAINADIEVI